MAKFTLKIEIDTTKEDAGKINTALPVLIKKIPAKDFQLLQKLATEKPMVFNMALNHLRNLF